MSRARRSFFVPSFWHVLHVLAPDMFSDSRYPDQLVASKANRVLMHQISNVFLMVSGCTCPNGPGQRTEQSPANHL